MALAVSALAAGPTRPGSSRNTHRHGCTAQHAWLGCAPVQRQVARPPWRRHPKRLAPPSWGASITVVRAQQEQQQQQQEEAVEQQDDLPDFQPPKFRPFTARNSLHRAMTSYRSWHDCGTECGGPPGQTLLVTPLSADWVNDTADLLTDSFAEAMAAAPYKNFLRRRVRQYLEAHMQLPPKAVVLVALLLPPPDQGGYPQQQQAGTAAAAAASSSSSPGGSGLGDTAAPPSALGSASSSLDGELELGDGMAIHPVLGSLGSLGSLGGGGSSSSSSSEEEAGAAAAVGGGAVLVGVVELSFSASTRSKYLTLTPPEDRPYLCNMAIHPDHRGRGYGSVLLRSAEALVAQLGESEIYLHLRVQDMPAARLYKRAGYDEVASDSFLVRLLAIDQRRLLRKRLPKPPPQQEPPQQQQQAPQPTEY